MQQQILDWLSWKCRERLEAVNRLSNALCLSFLRVADGRAHPGESQHAEANKSKPQN